MTHPVLRLAFDLATLVHKSTTPPKPGLTTFAEAQLDKAPLADIRLDRELAVVSARVAALMALTIVQTRRASYSNYST